MDKTKSSSKKAVRILLLTFLPIAVIFILLFIFQKPVREIVGKIKGSNFVVTAVKSGAEDGTVGLLDYNASTGNIITASKDSDYKITLDNSLSSDINVEIMTSGAAHKINCEDAEAENVFEIGSGNIAEINLHADEDGEIYFSFFLIRDKESSCYISSGDDLSEILKRDGMENVSVFLLNDIVSESLEISCPVLIECMTKSLEITEAALVITEEKGKISIKAGDDKLKISDICIDAPNADIEINPLPELLSGDELGYFACAAKLNGKKIDNSIVTVTSNERWERLYDTERYPKLKSGAAVVFSGEYKINPLNDNKSFTLDRPVSLDFGEKIDLEGVSFYIETREESRININSGSAREDFLSIEAPFCDVIWKGKNVPKDETVFSMMNVQSCNGKKSDERMGGKGEDKILSLSISSSKNSGLPKNVDFTLKGNVLTADLRITFPKSLITKVKADISVSGGTASFSKEVMLPDGSLDLSKETVCTVTDKNGQTRSYLVRANFLEYKLPVIRLTTEGGKTVTSKETYIQGGFSLENSQHNIEKTNIQIRGRGNSTWNWDKKPYRIKFSEKTSVLGLAPAKNWILLANYSDKSLIRNTLAFDIGRVLDNMDFMLHQIPVDVFMNGSYVGVYTLGEHMEANPGRVAIDKSGEDDTGYLLELGGTEEGDVLNKDYFNTGNLSNIRIQAPDRDKITEYQVEYIKNYVSGADKAVRALDGYEEYIDVPSVIDWFLLHEFAYNLDSCFRRSCFFTKDKGGKLKMGPPWDFDLAFGNFSRDNKSYDNWASIGSADKDSYIGVTWFNYLIKDESFKRQLKARWAQIGGKMLSAGLDTVENQRKLLEPSQVDNFAKWNILGRYVAFESSKNAYFKTHGEHLTYIESFLKNRKSWMDKKINSL